MERLKTADGFLEGSYTLYTDDQLLTSRSWKVIGRLPVPVTFSKHPDFVAAKDSQLLSELSLGTKISYNGSKGVVGSSGDCKYMITADHTALELSDDTYVLVLNPVKPKLQPGDVFILLNPTGNTVSDERLAANNCSIGSHLGHRVHDLVLTHTHTQCKVIGHFPKINYAKWQSSNRLDPQPCILCC